MGTCSAEQVSPFPPDQLQWKGPPHCGFAAFSDFVVSVLPTRALSARL